MKLPFRRVMIFARDPARLAAFYAEAFGLEVVERRGTFVDLGPLAFHKAAKPSPGAHKLCFYAKDVAAAAERLRELGATMKKPAGSADDLWFCDGRDLEGNVFQISNRK